ncbi:MAG: hypothetical protein WED07_15790 [Candidatus Freyarchaeum deiterrae]
MQKKEKRPTSEDDEAEETPWKSKEDTENIYDDEQRDKMVEDDEITLAEAAFMEGRDEKPWKRKYKPHFDTESVQTSADDYFDD